MNKRVDRGVEFNRLQVQYLYILARGLLSVFLAFVILYMTGVNWWFCILFEAVSISVLVLVVFRLGKKYDPHGLMKLAAAKYHPFHVINRRHITSLLKRNNHEKHPESGNTRK